MLLKSIKKILSYLLFLGAAALYSQESCYEYKTGDQSGIGKWYLGREISHVMGYQGMSWLERDEREKEENTTVLLNNMKISKTDIIADIGAGSGYHIFKMAALATEGTIYGVDLQEEMLAAMSAKKKQGKVTNVQLVKGSEQGINLAPNTVDKVLIVDVYHEMNYPYEMMTAIKQAMRPNAKLYLIEYRGEDPEVPIKRLHKMTESQAVKEMKAVGLSLEKNIANLPWQHCMVFVKNN